MSKLNVAVIGLMIGTLMLGACATHDGPKTKGGTLLGAAAGGLIGSRFGGGGGKLAAVAAGTLIGSMIGRSVGQSLDRADRLYAQQAEARSLEYAPTGTTTSWRNPDSGNYGTVTPIRTYERNDGQYCREYQQTVTVGGRTENAYGTACRQPDGSWRVVN